MGYINECVGQPAFLEFTIHERYHPRAKLRVRARVAMAGPGQPSVGVPGQNWRWRVQARGKELLGPWLRQGSSHPWIISRKCGFWN